MNLFTTITNANFDKESRRGEDPCYTDRQRCAVGTDRRSLPVCPKRQNGMASDNWEEKAQTVGVLSTENEDIRSLRELITYGLKGLSAYSKHANAAAERRRLR